MTRIREEEEDGNPDNVRTGTCGRFFIKLRSEVMSSQMRMIGAD